MIYRNYSPMSVEPYFRQHMSAMTEEALHSKAEIAVELAARDMQIQELTATIRDMETDRLPQSLRISYEYCMIKAMRSNELAKLAGITLTNASNRLLQLHKRGLLDRKRVPQPSGGHEYVYYVKVPKFTLNSNNG